LTPLQPGDRLDHYRIDSLVARGGMASVFRATDLASGLPVAIKLPHPEAECDPVLFDRFEREREIGQRLDHPGIVKVLACGDRSRVYMAMEWVEGRLLREILAENKRLPGDRAARIAVEVCEALEYIHAQGVAHRDLKPENIMVDAQDRIKIVDFGLASQEGARRLTFGKFSRLMGTPDYISPEQVEGKRGDCRSDIYSLGAILYEMLTGAVPFVAANPLAAMNLRLLKSPVAPREIDPEISTGIQEVLFRSLERDPRNRYPGARQFAWDLEHLDRVVVEHRSEIHGPSAFRKRIAGYCNRLAALVSGDEMPLTPPAPQA
jgi:serine/threonine-protein kinase